jgi:hypothetical protein
MPELRDLLDDAAGNPRDLPDIAMIMRRARPQLVRRRVGAAAAALAVAAVVVSGVIVLAEPDTPGVVQPAPPPGDRRARPVRQGQLEPGRYEGTVGGRHFLLTTGNDNWSVLTARPSWLALTYRQYILHVQQWADVVPPASTDGTGRAPVPADLVDWLEAHPRLAVREVGPVTVGGLAGVALDIRVLRPLALPPGECTSKKCVLLATVAGAGEAVDIEQGQRARLVVLGEPGNQVVLSYRAPEREFAVLDQAADVLLSGLEFDGS